MSYFGKFISKAINNVASLLGDSTRRITLSTEQQANKTEPYGDLLRLQALHGFAKGGVKWYSQGRPAQLITSNSEPFNVTTGQTLQIKINGGDTRTVTFTPASSGAATADELSTQICQQINYTSYPTGEVDAQYYGQAYVHLTQTGTNMPSDNLKIAIFSGSYGTSSTIEIVGGTALTGLGLSVGVTTGTAGDITLPEGAFNQLGWWIGHDFPNNPASNNKHQHLSAEVPDANGEMQTRFSIEFYRNVAQMLISSAYLVLDTYPLFIASSANSNKEIYFSRDNTGRDISRVFGFRVNGDSSGGNLDIRAFDNSGVATSLMTFNRLSKFAAMGGALQTRIRTSANTAQTTMTLSPQNGNVFQLSGTGTVNYIANTDWQAGSFLIIRLQGAATLTHNAGSPTATNRPLWLSGSTNYTAGANGSTHVFYYDGTGYSNRWEEVSRITY